MDFFVCRFLVCRTRSEDSAGQVGRKAAQGVPRKESEGEVTQGETERFDRSDRVLPGEPFRHEDGSITVRCLVSSRFHSFSEGN
jgi:hypothetical protein